MTSLQGVGVLVTRPELQAAPLCRLLEDRGAQSLRFPVIRIEPTADDARSAGRGAALGKFDIAIFVSANAVRFGATLLAGRDVDIAAVGPATARALASSGRNVTIQPSQGFDSANLLLHSAFAHPAGKRILLVKGCNGRELLEQTLTQRGAHVMVAEVYRRERITPSAAQLSDLESRFARGAIQVVTATSLEIALHLLDLATPELRRGLERAHWLVPSERVAAAVHARGLHAPLIRAESADDHDLVAALSRWRCASSDAKSQDS
jgi:uroporphyrinogen-III synthase